MVRCFNTHGTSGADNLVQGHKLKMMMMTSLTKKYKNPIPVELNEVYSLVNWDGKRS